MKATSEVSFGDTSAPQGGDAFDHYRHTLEELGRQPGTLALIFGKAQNKFQDPAKLRRVIVDLIDNEVAVKANVSAANVKARSAGRNVSVQRRHLDTPRPISWWLAPSGVAAAPRGEG
jgi:hypothetical protein